MPALSIIIPVYPNYKWILRMMKSIDTQSMKNDIEVIVVADGFHNELEENEIAFQFDDLNICFIHHETNKGTFAARMTGLYAANGKWIHFADMDDVFENYLHLAIEDAEKENVDVIRTNRLDTRTSRKKYKILPKRRRFLDGEERIDYFFGIPESTHPFPLWDKIVNRNFMINTMEDIFLKTGLTKDTYMITGDDVIMSFGIYANAFRFLENTFIGNYIWMKDNPCAGTTITWSNNIPDDKKHLQETYRKQGEECHAYVYQYAKALDIPWKSCYSRYSKSKRACEKILSQLKR